MEKPVSCHGLFCYAPMYFMYISEGWISVSAVIMLVPLYVGTVV